MVATVTTRTLPAPRHASPGGSAGPSSFQGMDAASSKPRLSEASAAATPRPCLRRRRSRPTSKHRGYGRGVRWRSFRLAVKAVSEDGRGPGGASSPLPGGPFLPPLGDAGASESEEREDLSTSGTSEAGSRKERLNVLTPSSPQLGKWCWNHETNSLKLRASHFSPNENKSGPLPSHLPKLKPLHPMPVTDIREKLRKGRSIHFAENEGTTSERLSEKRFIKRDEKSTRGTSKRPQHSKVTLNDAKYVALFLLQDTEMQRIYSFTAFMRDENLDEFLMALLYYLSHYLEKQSLDKKPKSYMASHIEKKEMELVIEKLKESQKYLAQKYCILVLGLGMPDKHHMACGKEKVSDTQKDWKFFEAFFTFCTYVAWVVFRRQHLTEIDEEIGRLFRTNMFNIARRKREDEESGGDKRRMTFVQFRRMMAKRPAIKTTLNMRSPALSTLLPSPKDHAQHLFERSRGRLYLHVQQSDRKELATYESVAMPIVGILGEPRSLFNTYTLLPSDQENNPEPTKRNASLITENNARVQKTLNSATRFLAPIGVLIK